MTVDGVRTALGLGDVLPDIITSSGGLWEVGYLIDNPPCSVTVHIVADVVVLVEFIEPWSGERLLRDLSTAETRKRTVIAIRRGGWMALPSEQDESNE
jgi:hypothetical protein